MSLDSKLNPTSLSTAKLVKLQRTHSAAEHLIQMTNARTAKLSFEREEEHHQRFGRAFHSFFIHTPGITSPHRQTLINKDSVHY